MRIALLTTDNREFQRTYEEAVPRFGPAVEGLLEGLFRLTELELHVIACAQRPMRAPDKLSDNTWFHLLHVPKRGWLRTGYQGCVRAVRRKLRELDPEIVHGQGTERECALSAALSGFPNLVTIHGNMGAVARAVDARLGSFLWCAARIESVALARTNGVLCNSAYTESNVRRHNQRTWRVPNALRLPFLDISPPERPRPEKPVLLVIGVIAPYKRQLAALALAELLHRDGEHFEMHFAGAVDQRSHYGKEFLKRVRRAEKEGYARYLGTLNLPALVETLDRSSALVHIPLEEAFGLVVAESLSRNLKFFGARVGGIPDIAEGIEGAELFEAEDEEGLRDAIRDWLGSGSPRPTAAASLMRSRYHPELIARRHLEIYRELAADEPR